MKNRILLLPVLLLFFVSCQQKEETAQKETTPDIKSDVMTPEVLWKLGRVNNVKVSPDGNRVLYGIKRYELEKNSGQNDLFMLDIKTGKTSRLTSSAQESEVNARWRPDGKKIGYLAPDKEGSMQLWEMQPDGSSKTKISDINDGLNGFEYAPDQKHILYIKDVKLDKTANEIYTDLPKANARIIDNLMYRHWDAWHDYKYSHVFYAAYDGEKLSGHKDIMKDEPYDSPLSPWGGMEQITWTPDNKEIVYVCKKMTPKEYTLSTNSEIYAYNLESGKTTNMTADGFEGFDRNPVFSPDGKMVAWESMEEDGFESDKERIFVKNLKTGEIKNMSKGFDQSSHGFTWNKDGSKLYFISGIHATYQKS